MLIVGGLLHQRRDGCIRSDPGLFYLRSPLLFEKMLQGSEKHLTDHSVMLCFDAIGAVTLPELLNRWSNIVTTHNPRNNKHEGEYQGPLLLLHVCRDKKRLRLRIPLK